MTTPKLTEAVIRAGANDKSFQRGRELYRSGAISNTAIQGQSLSGECLGNESPFYRVRVELDGGGIRSATCTCPYDFGGYCKHIVAPLCPFIQRKLHKSRIDACKGICRDFCIVGQSALEPFPTLAVWSAITKRFEVSDYGGRSVQCRQARKTA